MPLECEFRQVEIKMAFKRVGRKEENGTENVN
jgi:hypothetical protein